mmetsp:Transcript_25851/g.60867  ORF Transcript_25851/g.60867 Transcript_25851/m.60867 type:complete len:377 (-) Transcript_25851:2468-3598(-)
MHRGKGEMMERKRRAVGNNVHRVSSFLFSIFLSIMVCFNVVNKTKPQMVTAFLFQNRIFRHQHFSKNEERCNLLSFNRVGSFENDRNTISRKYHQLMGHRVAIIGGGLAGLSAAYHLLEKSPSTDITIVDRNDPGTGGASAVAGGLLHPLSPKGKLAYKGFEGLAAANQLVEAASFFEDNVVLRNNIYRIATTETQAVKFRETATILPELATWIEPDSVIRVDNQNNIWEENYFSSEKNVLGALRLSGDCKVVHMRSYLKGLWSHCKSTGSGEKRWITREDLNCIESDEWKELLRDFDCVIFAAGSGLFESSLMHQDEFPITLVRGQSIEMTIANKIPWNAVLCGKYVSPLLENNRVLIGKDSIRFLAFLLSQQHS